MPVKRKTHSYSENLPPLKIYLDDVERIVEVLEGAGAEVSLDTRDYIIDAVGDLHELPEEYLTALSIEFHNPKGSIILAEDSARLHFAEDNPESRGLLQIIIEILLQTKRPLRRFTSRMSYGRYLLNLLVPITIVLLGLALDVFLSRDFMEPMVSILLIASVPFVLMALVVGIYLRDRNKYSIIYLKQRADAPPFLRRNQDNIILGIVFLILGAILGAAATQVFSP